MSEGLTHLEVLQFDRIIDDVIEADGAGLGGSGRACQVGGGVPRASAARGGVRV